MTKEELKAERKHQDKSFGGFARKCFKSKDGLLYKRNIKVWNYYFDYELVNFGNDNCFGFAPGGISKHHLFFSNYPVFLNMVKISPEEYSEAKKRFLANPGIRENRITEKEI